MNVDRYIYAFDTFVQILNLHKFFNFNVKLLTSIVEVFLLGVIRSKLIKSTNRNIFEGYNKSYMSSIFYSRDLCLCYF